MKKRLLALLALCTAVGAFAEPIGGYLFVTFRGEATPMTEQIYFMISKNGLDWKALNHADPVLVSKLGDKGVRDPFIMRSHDNKKFYCIATDLSINLTHDWGRAQNGGSKSIVIWESPDLVHWSEPRLVKVAPDDAGCTWAPEAAWDNKKNEYMVFWASKTGRDNYSKQRIWAAYTKDFKTFGKPFIYLERPNDVIDTTIDFDNGTYYRFSKDETVKSITMEKSKHLMSGWSKVANFSLATMQGYEGPTCFMINPPKGSKPAEWCLLLDHYRAGTGYEAFETADLASGDFKRCDKMNFPFSPVRHGTVMALTKDEYNRLKSADRNGEIKVEDQ